jgi:hypothetical protein
MNTENQSTYFEPILTEQAFAVESDVKIYTSSQYDKFKLSEFNREPGHYKKVKESIKQNDYTQYQPILVNGNLEIVDGQNRFLACKELGKPIHFTISEELHIFAAAQINQASKNWSSTDYAHHFARRGKESYIRLLDICAKHRQSISTVMAFGKQSGGSRSHTENIKNGTFEFRDDIDIDDFFEHMNIFDKYYHFSKRDKFVKAVANLYVNPDYDKSRMEARLRKASAIVNEQPRVELMVDELLKLYNYCAKKPLIIKSK